MTNEDIIRMARESWLMDKHDCSDDWFVRADIDERNIFEFAALVAAAEREACVELCLEHSKLNIDNENAEFSHLASYEFGKQVGASTCATTIRARGEQEQPR